MPLTREDEAATAATFYAATALTVLGYDVAIIGADTIRVDKMPAVAAAPNVRNATLALGMMGGTFTNTTTAEGRP